MVHFYTKTVTSISVCSQKTNEVDEFKQAIIDELQPESIAEQPLSGRSATDRGHVAAAASVIPIRADAVDRLLFGRRR